MLGACSSYEPRVSPVPLPEAQANHVDVDGAKITARAYVDRDSAQSALGFDARAAGLLPVRFVMDNQSEQSIRVDASQTFLIDREGNAWPLLSADQAYERMQDEVEFTESIKGAGKPAALLGVAGALVGAAIGIVSGENVGDAALKGGVIGAGAGAVAGGSEAYSEVGYRIRDDLARESLNNRRIEQGELAYGYLFFPGKNEAGSAQKLRLALQLDDQRRIVNLNL